MRIVQTIIFCLLFNLGFSQESSQVKHTIVLKVSIDSLGCLSSISYVPDSSNIKGLTQDTFDKMLTIAKRKAKSMQFPLLKYGHNQLVRFDFITVNDGSIIEKQ